MFSPSASIGVSLKRSYGDALVFDGTIGTQTTMPFADEREVRRMVEERVWTLGRDGALIRRRPTCSSRMCLSRM